MGKNTKEMKNKIEIGETFGLYLNCFGFHIQNNFVGDTELYGVEITYKGESWDNEDWLRDIRDKKTSVADMPKEDRKDFRRILKAATKKGWL